MLLLRHDHCASVNESTAGADASVEALKLYDIKLHTLAYLALHASSLATCSSRSLTMYRIAGYFRGVYISRISREHSHPRILKS